MQIRVALLPQLAGDVSEAVCVVIDVLRATTVISTLFERHCPRVYVAASHARARDFARRQGYVLCGETGGYKVPDFDYGNSPVEFARLDFTGRPCVLSTTNGTKATAAVANAHRVFLGAANNRLAVAQAAWAAAHESTPDTAAANKAVTKETVIKEAATNEAPINEAAGSPLETAEAESSSSGITTARDIVVVCSGTDDQFTLEDATVAGMYVESLVAQAGAWSMPRQTDAAIAVRRLWEKEPNLLRGWMEGVHAQTLADRGFGEDLGYCAAIDTRTHVPTLVAENEAGSVRAPVILVR